ncbi:tRNA pseudouridine synthase a [Plakobranchus ocellatus]|uniref:tRNA pseudouridine synthase a n=1 Tax=Plakobranchus ocellatus TaxID=259542 RepID=A0AAV4APM3_9GAST|nr:tRNA pseudouridine synthase a [Plakobranchus ocellatus]
MNRILYRDWETKILSLGKWHKRADDLPCVACLGILLVIVVAVGWKCTPRGHEPLHALFGIGNFRHGRNGGQTRERRRRRHRNRDGNWYGGVLYPEFQYRRPPPSYAASMQDYQNQQLQQGAGDAGRRSSQQGGGFPSGAAEDRSLPNSPPPSYRSRASTAHSGIHIAFPSVSAANSGGGGNQDGEMPGSRPPTYRSRAPSRRPSLPRNEATGEYGSGDGDIDFTGQAYPGAVISSDSPTQNVSSLEDRHIAEGVAGSGAVAIAGAAAAAVVAAAASSIASTSMSTTSSPSHASSSSPHSPGSVTLQVYTIPTVRADNQNSSSQFQVSSTNAAFTSGARNSPQQNATTALSTSTSQAPIVTASTQQHPTSVPPARLPSLHQRMESSDRRMLEDALQSLEEHISEAEGSNREEGIVNPAASFESEIAVEDFNTHL